MTRLALLLSLATPPAAPCPQDTSVRPPPAATPTVRPRTKIHASIGTESLTAGMSNWTDVTVRLQGGVAPGISLHAEAVRTSRFDLIDTQLRLGASARLAHAWTGHAEVAVSPTGNVLPDAAASATLSRQLGRGWVVGASGRHDAYDMGAVNIGTLVTDHYVADFLFGYAFSMAFVGAASAPSHRVSASRYYGAGSALTVLASAGQSAERVTPQNLLVTDVVAVALWGVHWVRPWLGVTYGAALTRHVDLYARRRAELGVRAGM